MRVLKSFMAAIALSSIAFGAAASIEGAGSGTGNYADLVFGGEGGGKIDATTRLGSASGKYQFTYATLKDLGFISSGPETVPAGAGEWPSNVVWTGKGGVNSRQDFLNNVAAQDLALSEFTQSNWNSIQRHTPLGTSVNGVTMTQGGALYTAHMLGNGGYAQWASCGFQAHCLDAGQAAANNMTKEQLQAHMMKRLAEGGGYDPSVIASPAGGEGGYGGGSTPAIENPVIALMPWV